MFSVVFLVCDATDSAVEVRQRGKYTCTLNVLLFHQCVEYFAFVATIRLFQIYFCVHISNCTPFVLLFFRCCCCCCQVVLRILTGRRLLESFWQGCARCRWFYSSKHKMLFFSSFFFSLSLSFSFNWWYFTDGTDLFSILFKRIESFPNVSWIVGYVGLLFISSSINVEYVCVSVSLFFLLLLSDQLFHDRICHSQHKIWNAIIRNMMSWWEKFCTIWKACGVLHFVSGFCFISRKHLVIEIENETNRNWKCVHLDVHLDMYFKSPTSTDIYFWRFFFCNFIQFSKKNLPTASSHFTDKYFIFIQCVLQKTLSAGTFAFGLI